MAQPSIGFWYTFRVHTFWRLPPPRKREQTNWKGKKQWQQDLKQCSKQRKNARRMQKKSKWRDWERKTKRKSRTAFESISLRSDLIWTHCFALAKPSFWISITVLLLLPLLFCVLYEAHFFVLVEMMSEPLLYVTRRIYLVHQRFFFRSQPLQICSRYKK